MVEDCDPCQDAQDEWDAENMLLASGHNAGRSDTGSVFADAMRCCINYRNIITLLTAWSRSY